MNRLVQAALITAVVAACSRGVGAFVHDCIHDEPTLMTEQRRLLDSGLSTQSYGRAPGNPSSGPIFPAAEAQPIRITFDTTGLTQAGAYCSNEGDVIPSYKTVGSTVTCGYGQTLTPSARSYLVNTLLPAAAAKVTNVVKVQPLTGNLVVPSTTTCGDTPIPASHTTTGVANADLVIYVTSAPLGNGVFTFAFSSACNRDQTQRIVVGKLNIDPNRLTSDTFTEGERLRMIVHELYHILGVSAVEMFRASNKQLEFKRGKQVAVSVLPQVTSWVRSFTGCTTLSGAEFEDENVGASLSSSSHWERLLYYEEIMTAKPGTAVSGLTLAFLAGINVGYTTDSVGTGDSMYWGKSQGCGLHENSCSTVAGGMGKLFCPDTASTASQCTYDRGAIGYCAPDYFINGCNKIEAYANRICNVEAPETDDDLKYGYVYAADSRCLEAKDVHREDFNPYFSDFPVCFNTRCSVNKVEFRMPDSGVWATCNAEGELVETPGTEYTGSIVCPNAMEFCRTFGVAITPDATSPPQTPIPATPVPATPSPATPIPPTPVPGMPVTPSPATPIPPTPVPGMPVTPSPPTAVPPTPVPGMPVTPSPPTAVPPTPVPGMPVTPSPLTPVPPTPVPGMPVTPSPQTPVPPAPVPGMPVTPTPGTPIPGAPVTFAPPRLAPLPGQPRTPAPQVTGGVLPPDAPGGLPPATTSISGGIGPSLTTIAPAGGPVNDVVSSASLKPLLAVISISTVVVAFATAI